MCRSMFALGFEDSTVNQKEPGEFICRDDLRMTTQLATAEKGRAN